MPWMVLTHEGLLGEGRGRKTIAATFRYTVATPGNVMMLTETVQLVGRELDHCVSDVRRPIVVTFSLVRSAINRTVRYCYTFHISARVL